MDSNQIQKQKQRLEEIRGRLRQEIERMINTVRREERPIGEHEQRYIPSESIEKEIHVENTEETIGRAVDAALERIESGNYGICQQCGCQIPVDRLDAIPYAERCIACEQQLQNA